MNKKKIIQIIGFIIVIIFFATALWWMFWRKPVAPSGPGQGQLNNGKLPGISEGPPSGTKIDPVTGLPISETNTKPGNKTGDKLPSKVKKPEINDRALGGLTKVKKLVTAKIKGPMVTKNGQINFYNTRDNKFYKLDSNGKPQVLSDKEFYNVKDVKWSPDGEKAILEYPDSSNILYDFKTKKQVTLPKQMTEFNFSPKGEKIAFKWKSELPNDDWLGVALPNGSGMNFVEPMNDAADKVQVEWSPNNQVIALYQEGKGTNESDVYFIGQNGENFKSLTVRGRGFKGKWLDDGKNMLYQIYSDKTGLRPSLWISRVDGENVGKNNNPLGVNTWIDKCTIKSTEAYCAVPESLPEGVVYVPEIADTIPDLIYRIDLVTGARTLLARPVGDEDGYSATNLSVSPDGKKLYFVDKKTGELNSIDL